MSLSYPKSTPSTQSTQYCVMVRHDRGKAQKPAECCAHQQAIMHGRSDG